MRKVSRSCRHRGHVPEGLAHDVLEPLVDLLLAPEEPGAILHPLEVGHGHPSGVREDVGHDEDPLLVEDLVGALRRRAVRALDDDLCADVAGVASPDLVLVRGGNEDVALELEISSLRSLTPGSPRTSSSCRSFRECRQIETCSE